MLQCAMIRDVLVETMLAIEKGTNDSRINTEKLHEALVEKSNLKIAEELRESVIKMVNQWSQNDR